MNNYLLRESDNAMYWCVPEELIDVFMPDIPMKTVLVCNGYLVFIKPKKYLTQVPKEMIN